MMLRFPQQQIIAAAIIDGSAVNERELTSAIVARNLQSHVSVGFCLDVLKEELRELDTAKKHRLDQKESETLTTFDNLNCGDIFASFKAEIHQGYLLRG